MLDIFYKINHLNGFTINSNYYLMVYNYYINCTSLFFVITMKHILNYSLLYTFCFLVDNNIIF